MVHQNGCSVTYIQIYSVRNLHSQQTDKRKMKLTVISLLLTFGIWKVYGANQIFCYYTSFAQTRRGIGKFVPENINPYLCTHIIFAFVDVSRDGRSLVPVNDNDVQPERGLYDRTLALKRKNPKLKILLAVGGWNIGSQPFLPMISNRFNRYAWVRNVVRYLRRYGFDGFDMDWEFPGTRGSPPGDKYRFTQLMKELYETFAAEARKTGREKLILTLATASGSFFIGKAYEPRKVINYVDYMLLMTYNYHGQWEEVTGHHSGIFKHWKDGSGEKSELNAEWSINFWLRAGIPRSKLIIGIPTYGMSYTLQDPNTHDLFAPANGGGNKGAYTDEKGVLSYYEICENIRERGWKSAWIDPQKVPYAYGGNQWVGFENIISVQIKAQNIINKGLAGAFIWSLEMDDFTGSCGQGRFPLTNKISNILLSSDVDYEYPDDVQPPNTILEFTTRAARVNNVDCTKAPRKRLADPRSCRHYILCLPSNQAIRMKCPKGTRFDRSISMCTYYRGATC
ncbi:chitinase-3-like protein 1 isoform X1 [Octopus sinensis]|uniref:Chitinase-3-like protein 1 isoform X1 n=2 Tax=Octopus sinensis TaxID=2607531 RepID=A0A7E6F1T2_9MOLL|nr:chitinase-3-like protein 1 isoform X1 [Octopus sinensis]